MDAILMESVTRRRLFRASVGVAIAAPAIIASRTARAVSNFQENAGTNGFVVAPFNLMSSELNSVSSGSAAVSSVGGSSGVFSQSNTTNAIFGSIYFTAGGSFTPTGTAYISGWFLLSTDGGSTFETVTATPSSSVLAIPRPPDFVIPLSAAAYASGNIAWCAGRFVQMPFESFKVEVQNFAGVSLPSSGNLIKVGTVVTQAS